MTVGELQRDSSQAVEQPIRNSFERASSRRLLVILPFSPNPIRARPLDMMAQLVRHAKVDVVCLDDGTPIELPPQVHHSIIVPSASKLARISRILLGLARGIPIYHEFYNSWRLPEVLARLDLSQYDAILVHRLPVHRLLKHPNVIYDCEDCHSRRSRLFTGPARSYKRLLYAIDAVLTPRHEVAACNAARLVLVAAEREIAPLRRLGVAKPIETWMQDRRVGQPPRSLCHRERFVVSFHGKMSYEPNVLALRALNRLIAPALDVSHYDLRIIGKCPPAFRKSFRNLNFTGYVRSIPEAIRDSDLAVFPLMLSVGFPNKAMESLAVGVPFIATPSVIEGLPPMPELLERGVYIREIDEFPDTIRRFSRLSIGQRQEISRSCYEYVERVYDSPSRDEQWEWILG